MQLPRAFYLLHRVKFLNPACIFFLYAAKVIETFRSLLGTMVYSGIHVLDLTRMLKVKGWVSVLPRYFCRRDAYI